jgi:hypothetical protein
MSTDIESAEDPRPVTPEIKQDLANRVSEMVSRMKEGVPLIRRIESASVDSNEMSMCMAFLSEDLSSLNFVKKEGESDTQMAISSLNLVDVEEVAISKADKNALALFVPNENLIAELIFASEEDWSCWYYGLKILCASDKAESTKSEATEVQDESLATSPSPVPELMELVRELQIQNGGLKEVLSHCQTLIDELKDRADKEEEKRIQSENENSRLIKLLSVRDETIGELATLVQSLIAKQSSLVSMHAKPSTSSGSSRRSSLDVHAPRLYKHSERSSAATPATTTSSSYFEGSSVLEGLESQLKKLDDRKKQLELLLESVTNTY